MNRLFLACLFFLTRSAIAQIQTNYLLKPDRVFDGETMHEGWVVQVEGDKIDAVGPVANVPANGAEVIELPGQTLLPGLIEGHSHLFLHPYNETPWNDQVLRESRSMRTARATVHARKTLLAGFTTVRDLGTEGADYDDVSLKQAINQGIIPGPRMVIATRGIVATGSYRPKLSTDIDVPQGAQEADGHDDLVRVVRSQIGHGADLIKVYANYGTALCPTLAAGDAVSQYRGWKKSQDPEPERIKQKRITFRQALDAGVIICAGGDVGVFPHGENARELMMMADYGMQPLDALRSATSINTDVFHLTDRGRIKVGLLADLVLVTGDPAQTIGSLQQVRRVMKGGIWYLP